MQNQTKITIIRHAESLLNFAAHDFIVNNNLSYSWKELSQHPEFLIGVKYNPDFLDCDITKKGIQQCTKAQKHVKDIQPDIILVSPLLRTLRTCNIVFKNHKHVPVVCQPLLAQSFRSSCGIASQTGSKVQEFPHFNFDEVLKEGEFWFIKNDSQQNQEKYFNLLRQHQEKSYKQKMHVILKFMNETMIHEHPTHLRARGYRIKQMIKQKYSGKYKHIAIVAHHNLMNVLMANKFDQNSQPIESVKAGNCEVVQNYLEQMLKHK